ncbi:DUF6191 domain-containing protein [Streptomyces sp. NPDC058855]|uniref:DUF6191 domain-containing protein n=1 Tax=Streptomyces sp. NPDC058855 TaxID=3346651 RepID=UPI0036BB6FE3
MFSLADEPFAPGREHTEDEQRRPAPAREDVGDADPARGPMDRASGRVTIRVPGPAAGVSGAGVDEVEPVDEGGGLAPAADAELGEDVGDVDAGRLG